MYKHINRVLLLLSVLLVTILIVAPAQAGFALLNFTFDNIVACPTGITITYSYQPQGPPVATDFNVTVIYYSPSPNYRVNTTIPAVVGTGTTVSFTFSTVETVGHVLWVGFSNNTAGYSEQSVTVSPACPTVTSPAAPTGPQVCTTDGRLDPYDCATPVALYLTQDADGWMLQVWGIDDSTSAGFFLMNLFQEDVPAPGDAPILLEEKDGVSLYLLPTGEFQVNAPYPKEPSKYYVYIFTIPGGQGHRADFRM